MSQTKKIKVRICVGTACHVMGGSELIKLPDLIPGTIKSLVEFEGANCLGYCRNHSHSNAPCVMIDDQVITEATIPGVLARITERIQSR